MKPESHRFLRDLVQAPSPSGYEGPAARVFREYLAQFADELTVDVSGNVIAALNPRSKFRVMLAGHLDQIGFIVTAISDGGLLRFEAVGDNDLAVSVGQRVVVHGRRALSGGIGRLAIHLLEQSGRTGDKVSLDDLWIDVGFRSREEALEVVEVGDPITYAADWLEMGESRLMAAGFDNKAGAFVVAEALRELRSGGLSSDVGVFAVGTVQEEIGYRGAAVAAYGLKPQIGLAVDVTHATDVPGVSERFGDVRLGAGPSISRGAYLSPVVCRLLRTAAVAEGISVQLEAVASISETDATTMQNVGPGLAAGLVGVPLRAMHTPCEVLDVTDLESCVKLVVAFCRSLDAEIRLEPWDAPEPQ